MLRPVRYLLAAVLVLPLTTNLARAAEPVKTIPVFKLSGALTEKSANEGFPFGDVGGPSLRELVDRLDRAAADPAVKAIVLLADGATMGQAQKEELRQAMARFRDAGKEIHAHSDSLQMGEYVLLSGATRLSLVPTGDLWLTGVYGEAMYLRGLLDKLGVQPDFLTCGAYKSAAEQFMRKQPSPEADAMQNWLIDGIVGTYVKLMAAGRGVSEAKVKAWIDGGPYTAEKALSAGLIDAIEHRQAFEARLKEKYGNDVAFDRKYGEKPQPKLDFGNPFAVFKMFGDLANDVKGKKSGKSSVAVVYVEGAIAVGSGSASPFGGASGAMSTDIRKALDEAARDDSIKAVVLRVNSPGGSAVASEIILDATRRVKAKKPFVVSMGDVAGSGGYYVACASDQIFADESTITASIGVVSGKMVTNPMWDKLGITFKAYQRGENAGMLASDHAFTPAERARMQNYMDEIYGVFKGHVLAARKDRLKKPLDELAGGRVFTGRQALEYGLVDRIGTLRDAVKYIAKEADLTEYDVRVVPEPKNFLEQILESAGGGKDDKKHIDGGTTPRLGARGTTLLDLAAPELAQLDPARMRLVRTALRQLQTLRAEHVCLMSPQFLVQ